MFRYKFSKENTDDISHYLEVKKLPVEERKPENVFATIFHNNGDWFLLGAFEYEPEGVQLYHLSEDDYYGFLDRFKPKIYPEKSAQVNYELAERGARQELIDAAKKVLSERSNEKIKRKLALDQAFHDEVCRLGKLWTSNPSEQEALEEQLHQLPIDILHAIANYDQHIEDSMKAHQGAANLALQDGTWMLQTTSTNLALGTSAKSASLASAKVLAGIGFGFGTGLIMGVGCGLLAKTIHKNQAIKNFKKEHGRSPTEKEKRLIERDAKHVGISVFGGITAWAVGAAVMQGAFYTARHAIGYTPIGVVFNICVSVAAGLFQAVTSVATFVYTEKDKCKDENGVLDEKKWAQRKASKDFKVGVAKSFGFSLISGFAWNMVGAYLPAPVQKVLKTTGHKVASGVVKALSATVGVALASFCNFFIAAKVGAKPERKESRSLFSFFRKKPKRVESDNSTTYLTSGTASERSFDGLAQGTTRSESGMSSEGEADGDDKRGGISGPHRS